MRKFLTDAHMREAHDRAHSKAHPNDVATDAEVAEDLANATFADDGALEVQV